MQAIFNLELHKLVQTNSESGIELHGFKKKQVILLGAAIAGFFKKELVLTIL